MELFNDWTGVTEKGKTSKDFSISCILWKVEDKRFVVTATPSYDVNSSVVSYSYDYEMSDNKFTLIDDKGEKETYVRPQKKTRVNTTGWRKQLYEKGNLRSVKNFGMTQNNVNALFLVFPLTAG